MRKQLQAISDEIQFLSNQHSRDNKGADRIVELSESALEMMKEALGTENGAVELLTDALRKLGLGIYDGHSFFQFSITADNAVEEAIGDLTRAERPKQVRPPAPAEHSQKTSYVAAQRLSEIRSLPEDRWDFAKLNQLCVELNAAHNTGSHYATAMLVRAITDHIPPLFEVETFTQLASNVGTRSFKEAMLHLDKGLRKIADGCLHQHIRRRESLPTEQQVNFSPYLDLLLGEIVIRGKG